MGGKWRYLGIILKITKKIRGVEASRESGGVYAANTTVSVSVSRVPVVVNP